MYVPVTSEDRERMGDRANEMSHLVEGSYYLRMKDGRCAQLNHADGDWVCGDYKRRPEACRQLERGSPDCLAERDLKRLRASRTSRRLLG
jgi:Fe-S-cluster containining protein